VAATVSTTIQCRTERTSQYEIDELPVAGVTAQSKQIVVKAFNRLFLQHVVNSVATVQLADGIIFIER